MKLFKSFSIYAGASFLNQGIGFLLLPIFTFYLLPEEYAQLSLINTMISIAIPFVILQVPGAIAVEYFKVKDSSKFNNYLSSAISNTFFSFLIIMAVFFIGARPLSNWLELDSFWVLMVPVFALWQLFPRLIQSYYQVSEKPIAFGIFSITKTSTELGLSILLVVIFALNYEGRLWAIWIAGLIFTIVAILLLRRAKLLHHFHIQREYQINALKFGIPLIPHTIGALVINASDQFFISKMVSMEALGIYSIGYKIGAIIMVLQLAFAQAWSPFLYKKLAEDTHKSKTEIVKAGYVFMALLFVCLLGLTVITPFIFKYILAKNYEGGMIFVFWVGLGYLFLGFYKVFTGFLFYHKKTKILGYLAGFNVLLNLTLNYFLILKYGTIGAAYATAISFFVFFLVVALISQRLFPMPWLSTIKSSIFEGK